MKKKSNSNFIMVIFIFIAVFWGTLESSPIIYYNNSESSLEANQLSQYVIQGAVHFLKAYSQFLSFLAKAESAEIESVEHDGELKQTLEGAIADSEKAVSLYKQLKLTADAKSYDKETIKKLLQFDYEEFRKKHTLIHPIFDKVVNFLEKGKVKELYGDLVRQMEEILLTANTLKKSIDTKKLFSLVNDLLLLNHKCSEAMLFGQYVAMVFKEIK